MHPRYAAHSRQSAGFGTFCVGFAFILSATVLNVAYDRVPLAQIESFPVVGPVFKAWGKLGVTILFVTLGLTVLTIAMLRAVHLRPRRTKSNDVPLVSPDPNTPPPPVPYYYSTDAVPQQKPKSGRVVLETRKYLPAAALSGATGWDVTQRRPPSE